MIKKKGDTMRQTAEEKNLLRKAIEFNILPVSDSHKYSFVISMNPNVAGVIGQFDTIETGELIDFVVAEATQERAIISLWNYLKEFDIETFEQWKKRLEIFYKRVNEFLMKYNFSHDTPFRDILERYFNLIDRKNGYVLTLIQRSELFDLNALIQDRFNKMKQYPIIPE